MIIIVVVIITSVGAHDQPGEQLGRAPPINGRSAAAGERAARLYEVIGSRPADLCARRRVNM